jgi:2-polyprenyl-3-methyl-5-hydroxy-6-metoxy-1,4-benzoquinol methylase
MNWLVFLCVNTVWKGASISRQVKTRKGVSILDVGCGKHSPLTLIAHHYKFEVVGLDIFEPYLKETKNKGVYQNVILADARYLPFKDKGFKAVTCIEVLEHVEKEDGEKILDELERVSRWLVLVSTPIGESMQHAYEGNPYQEHKYIWSVEELKARGFKMIRGRGLKGLAGDRWWGLLPYFLRPVQYVIEMIGTLFSYFFPKIASGVIAWKEISIS